MIEDKPFYKYGKEVRQMSPVSVDNLGGRSSGWKKMTAEEVKEHLSKEQMSQLAAIQQNQDEPDQAQRGPITQQVRIAATKSPDQNAPAEIEDGEAERALAKAKEAAEDDSDGIYDPFDQSAPKTKAATPGSGPKEGESEIDFYKRKLAELESKTDSKPAETATAEAVPTDQESKGELGDQRDGQQDKDDGTQDSLNEADNEHDDSNKDDSNVIEPKELPGDQTDLTKNPNSPTGKAVNAGRKVVKTTTMEDVNSEGK